jgi:hypothetical protein
MTVPSGYFALNLSDVKMPGAIDGLEVAELILAAPVWLAGRACRYVLAGA